MELRSEYRFRSEYRSRYRLTGMVAALSLVALSAQAQDAPAVPQQPPVGVRVGTPPQPAQTPPVDRPAATSPVPAVDGYGADPLVTLVNVNMANKTRRIMVLRELLKLGFTADDISRSLPLLRQLQEAEKSAPVDPRQALEQEYQALLSAKPGDPLPPNSGEKVQQAAQEYRDKQDRLWKALAKEIGEKKANGLRSIVGSVSYYNLQTGAKTEPIPNGPIALGTRYLDPNRLKSPGRGTVPPTTTRPRDGQTPHALVAPQPGGWSSLYQYVSPNLYPPWSQRLSLASLIDLMEQKLAAMKRVGP